MAAPIPTKIRWGAAVPCFPLSCEYPQTDSSARARACGVCVRTCVRACVRAGVMGRQSNNDLN